MRIISGTHKGKRINAPRQLSARPTTDMAKEALFNILNNLFFLNECRVLDLFTGTGNISYEFASRGAASITAVDKDARAIVFVNKTAKELEFPIRVFKSDVVKYLQKTSDEFDIIFADPPYQMEIDQLAGICNSVFERNLLTEEGLLIIEHTKHLDLSQLPHYSETRRYGGSAFSFFRREDG